MSERAKGWMVNGEVHIYLPHVESMGDLHATYYHETIGHKGVKEMLGEKKFNELLDKIFGLLPEEYKISSLESLKKIHPNKSDQELQRIVADEFMARIAEVSSFGEDYKSTWEKIVELVKELFGKGVQYQFGEAEKIATAMTQDSAKRLRGKAKNLKQKKNLRKRSPIQLEISLTWKMEF